MTWEIREGDVLAALREMPDESVHMVCTSPPYWGLRDYGVDGQIGLEPTPAAYLARMVEVFREVRRVLRSDGTCWVNMGDGYASTNEQRRDATEQKRELARDADKAYTAAWQTGTRAGFRDRTAMGVPDGLKPKDLIGMPWRLALALQADGWWLRSEIIWAKPNPMPESVRDRPTKAHEQIFLLTKSARYFYDADAIREPSSPPPWGDTTRPKNRYASGTPREHTGLESYDRNAASGRNARSVWTIATRPFPEAHFATFPKELPRRCILAGTSERGVCPQCGAPWTRVVERAQPPVVAPSALDRFGNGDAGVHRKVGGQYQKWLDLNPPLTTGWEPTCTHGGEPVPATVLDIFAGSGTTIMVALQLGRSGLGIELNPEYAAMARRRIERGTITQASSGQASLFGGEGGLP